MSSEVARLTSVTFVRRVKCRKNGDDWSSVDSIGIDTVGAYPNGTEAILSTRLSEEDHLAAICRGDAEAFSALYRHCYRVVKAVAVRIVKDAAEAEDLVQEIFLYIHRNCASFDRTKGSARTWIIQIAYHRAIDRRRYLQNRRFYSKESIEESATTIPDPAPQTAAYDRSLEGVLGREEAQTLFDSLSPAQRETFRLLFFEGYTFEEIATERGETLGNIRNHYYRGLEKIRRQLFEANPRPR